MFTGNRGCLVDEERALVRHHQGDLWITCVTSFRDWHSPLDLPHHWTPIFFLDDAVALAAGHRPCGLCRRPDYLAYRDAVTRDKGLDRPLTSIELNRALSRERLGRGRGLDRRGDRRLWTSSIDDLPDGSVVVGDDGPQLVVGERLATFSFDGWRGHVTRSDRLAQVITPPTSVAALANGFVPVLHPSATA
jgi:hypothetical protein